MNLLYIFIKYGSRNKKLIRVKKTKFLKKKIE
ncbi:MAG: hypothetical protein CNLJKLNK_00097 [Holosporales bacterium]